MFRTRRGVFPKKVWGLILLALTVLGGGAIYLQGEAGDRSPRSSFSAPALKPPPGRETARPGPAAKKGWELSPFWLPGIDQGAPALAEIRVVLQVAAPFVPEERAAGLRALRETIWQVLPNPPKELFRPEERSRLQETLTVRLNESIFQGTLKGVLLEIRPLS